MIGPPVPDHIQRTRDKRLGRTKDKGESESDEEIGPTLPPTAADPTQQEQEALERLQEQEALERLHRRSRADASQESRSDWLNVALGGGRKPPQKPQGEEPKKKDPLPDLNAGRPSLMEEHMASKKTKPQKEDAFAFRKSGSGQAARFLHEAKNYKSKFTQ